MGHRCLITGGAGFIGSHLASRLVAEGHDVIVLDNLVTGSTANVRSLEGSDRFQFVGHDVCDPFPHLGTFDRIFNLACPASPPHYQRDPVFTAKTNFLGALHGLELAQREGARLLQASTSEVYGDPEVHPQPESYRGSVSCTGPRACYDEGKRAAETLCLDFSRSRGTDVRIARIFNTYGPRMDPADGRVVSNFIVQALQGEPLTIYGEGQQTRSFCYVDDLVEGLLRLMEHPSEVGPINLGNQQERTVAELARLVIDLTGSKSELVHRPLPEDDPRQRRPDLTLAREHLGYDPKTGLEDGLKRTVAWFRDRIRVS